MGLFGNWELPGSGGSNSIINNPGQVFGGNDSVYNNTWDYVNSLFNPQAPNTQAPPAPPNASAVAGASLSQTLNQEQQQYTASTLLNGGGGTPMSQSPITASNVLRAGIR